MKSTVLCGAYYWFSLLVSEEQITVGVKTSFWVPVTLPLISCVTLGKSLTFSEPWFLYLFNEIINELTYKIVLRIK